MDIVVSHANADFDALACQVAVSMLYPGTIRVSQGSLAPVVRDFLALHKEYFELTPVKNIDLKKVRRLFVVDVRRRSRLRAYAPLLERAGAGVEIQVFDHHQAADDDLKGDRVVVEPVGAVATLLVERLRAADTIINPVEATALALGIYSDTGSLTYAGTTPRDAEAVTFLLGRGASLPTLRYFLHPPLKKSQRPVLIDLLEDTREVMVSGVRIGIGTVALEKSVPGLAGVVSQALTMQGFEVLFALVARKKRVTIIGRSRVPYVDIGSLLQEFGGGGHPGAGTAVLRNTDAVQARALLMSQLKRCPPQPSFVRHLISTPVHTVSLESPLEQVAKEFRRQKISGAPVLKNDQIVGIISLRDIRRARRQGRAHLPVSSCLSQEVVTITPDVPLVRALEKMLQHDVGRLPVLEQGHLIGIITRSDALRILYPSQKTPKKTRCS